MSEGAALTQNCGKKLLADLIAAHTLKVVLCSGTRPVVDGSVVLSGLTQIVANNYAIKTLANVTASQDDTNDRAAIDADDVVYTSLGAPSVPLTYGGVVDDTDSTKRVLGTWEITTQPNGANFTLQINALGLFLVS